MATSYKGKAEAPAKKAYAESFAEEVIAQLQQGTAPWQRPWKAGEFHAPMNPVSGTLYRGGNFVRLAMKGFEDPRWMTVKQANSAGYTIKKGSRGTPVVYWQFSREDRAA